MVIWRVAFNAMRLNGYNERSWPIIEQTTLSVKYPGT